MTAAEDAEVAALDEAAIMELLDMLGADGESAVRSLLDMEAAATARLEATEDKEGDRS